MRIGFTVVMGIGCMTVTGLFAGEDDSSKPYGLDKRQPLTTSRVVGSPDPPLPYRAIDAFANLKWDKALYVISEPVPPTSALPDKGTKSEARRMFVIEQKGKIHAFPNDPVVEKMDIFLDLPDRDFYGMNFHPKYAENRWVYVFSNGPNTEKVKKNRISRFNVSREAPFACDVASEKIILEYESNGHNGGDLAFGPDGYLYISSGDGTSDSDTNLTGQDISDLTGGMIRIDVERPDPDKAYSVPKDNPFLDTPNARPELWAYGFRNPWRIHFDPQGNLWCGDIGQDQYEMIEIVKRGDNYGWSVMEGGHPFYLERKPGPHPIVKPLIAHPHSIARSITGGVTYLGKKFPELYGDYVYGDYGTGKIWACRYDGKQLQRHREIADTPYQMLAFGLDQAGEIYFVDYALTGEYPSKVYTFERTPPQTQTHDFPRKLSETGLFRSVAKHEVEPALIPYSVNSALWSDGAHKERFIALPEYSQIEFAESGAWKFPEAGVLVKTFSLDREAGNLATRQRIETRLLVIQQNEWVGYTYLWNDEQTDATLVEAAGADRQFTIQDKAAPSGQRTQTWHYPSRAECMVCHSRAAGFVLGLNTLQMNKTHDYGAVSDNQLRTLAHIGTFKAKRPAAKKQAAAESKVEESDEKAPPAPFKLPKALDQYAKLPDPLDPNVDINDRARSYLHANCAQCHINAGGGNSAMDLTFKASLEKFRTIDVMPLHNQFGIADARLVAPGSPERSVLLHRMTTLGRGRMPPLASSVVDDAGTKLLREWITQIKPDPETKP